MTKPMFSAKTDARKFVLAYAAAPKVLAKNLSATFAWWGRQLHAKHARGFMSGQRGSVGLNRVTGHLARTARPISTGGRLDKIQTVYTFGAVYATPHEFGGDITFPPTTVSRHPVKTHKRRMVVPGRKRARLVTVPQHFRGPYARRGYTANYKPRLQARTTRERMLPVLLRRMFVDVDKTFEVAGGGRATL